jgi:F-type H+-transporting ATPase subunit alpha
MGDPVLHSLALETAAALQQAGLDHPPTLTPREVGHVTHIGYGIAGANGLPGVQAEELVRFADGTTGMVLNLDAEEIGIVLLGNSQNIRAGDEVRRTQRVLDVPVGSGVLGRVIDPIGRPLDGRGPIPFAGRWPVEREATPIMDRAGVTVPMQTGLKVIDALIPIGRGQRELILGDRQTGKTAIALDTIINQADKNVVCIYCAIGQRSSSVAGVIETLREHNALAYTAVVVAAGEEPAGLQFIAPFAATTIGEYFMEQGRDVLIVYDDLTRHAWAYRELSLLLRRPPGREAFPGDIFYLHSRLLERSTRLRPELGGGSLTALPIVETEAQNVSAYIPTNIISITDGQIYLSPDLFQKGIQPAVDVGRSVSRVGGKTQLPAYREVAGALRLSYAQFEELENFARFGTRLDEATQRTIERGRRVREVLKQAELEPLPVTEQIAELLAVTSGVLDGVAVDDVGKIGRILRTQLPRLEPAISRRIESGARLTPEERQTLITRLQTIVAQA